MSAPQVSNRREATREARISAKYLPALAPFIARDDVRFYLDGICIDPHPESGVIIAATNGYVLALIYDTAGYANGRWICSVPKRLIEACKLPRRRVVNVPQFVWFVGETVHVTNGSVESAEDANRPGPCHFETLHAPAIDATYPDWSRVIPRKVEPAEYLSAQLRLLTLFQEPAKLDPSVEGTEVRIYQSEGPTGPFVVRLPKVPEFFGVIMPTRTNELDPVPRWVLPEKAA